MLIIASTSDESTVPFQNTFGGGISRGRGVRRGRGRGRGRFISVQCRVYYKFGHTALVCYHRFNQQFQAPAPAHYQGYT